MEMAEGARFYFLEEISYSQKGDNKFLKNDVLELLEGIKVCLEKTFDFSQKGLEKIFTAFMEERQIKLGKIAQPLRVALTGKTASPGLFEVMEILGKEKVLLRIEKAISHIRTKNSTS